MYTITRHSKLGDSMTDGLPPPKHAGGKWPKGVSGNPGGKKRKVLPSDVAPESVKSAEKHKGGPWPKGVSGNPKGGPQGSRSKSALLGEALIDGRAEELIETCVKMALGGDPSAMRLMIERLVPARRERAAAIAVPPIAKSHDLIAAAAAITQAATDGSITPNEAAAISTLIGNVAKAIETAELAERLAKLEEQIAAKGVGP
jgi:hypothetical protein